MGLRCASAWCLVLLLVAGCAGGGDPMTERATELCRQMMEADPQYAEYALDAAGRSGSAEGRRMLVEALDDPRYQTALAAARGLIENGAVPDASEQQALRQVFEGKQGALRLTAAVGLARAGDPQARAWLGEQLGATGGSALQLAVTALAEMDGQGQVEPVLRQMLQSEDAPTREEAFAMLGRIDQPWAADLIVEGLEAQYGVARRPAIEALGRCGDPALSAKIVPFINTQGLVFATIEALGRLGDAGTADRLVRLLDREQPLVRVYAGAALLRLGRADAAQPVLEALAASDAPSVRQQLAEQLDGVTGDVAAGLLVALAADELPAVREQAVRALGRLDGEPAREALLAATQDPAYTVSTIALDAMSRVGRAEDVGALEPLLEHDNPYVIISAAHAIIALREKA